MGNRPFSPRARLAGLFLLGALLGGVSCKKATPTQPQGCTSAECAPVQPPSMQCGASVALTTSSHTVTSSTAIYNSPAVTGGTQPVSLTCTPESGSVFPKGATTVTCTATDAITRQATCTLAVTVEVPAPPIPVLQGTRFLAFGDSLTKGENGCNDGCDEPELANIVPGHEYPTILEKLLAARYTQQTVTVTNSGQGGETAVEGTRRLPQELAAFAPDALLVLEGVNDFYFDGTPADVANALRQDVRIAKGAGVKQVFLGTLPPQLPGYKRAWGTAQLDSANALIRGLALQENVVLVDVFAALNTDPETYISSFKVYDPALYPYPNDADGLHLTYAGRIKLAQTFFDAIQMHFEVKSSTQRATMPLLRLLSSPLRSAPRGRR